MSRSSKNSQPKLSRKKVAVLGLSLALLALTIVALKFLPSRPSDTNIPLVTTTHLSTNRQQQIQQHRESLLANPKDADAWGKYGMVLRAFDFDLPAADCFRRARELDPANPRWPYFLALSSRSHDPAEYARSLAAAVQLTGNQPPAPRFFLAKLLAEEGRFADADAHATALLQAHRNFVPARLLKAQVAFALTNNSQAIDLARQCLDDPRTRKSAAALLATAFQREGNREAALEAARISSSAPADQPIQGSFDEEIIALRGDPRALSTRAHALLASRQLPQAAAVIDQLVRDHPNFSETWLVQGRFMYLQQNFPAAEQAFRKSLQLDPASVQAFFQLGLVQLASSRLGPAADSFRQAIKLKPDFGPAWFNLGVALGRSRQLDQAAEALEQAIRYNPEYIDSYLLLADLHLQQGRKTEAQQLLDRAARLNPSDPKLHAIRKKLSTQ